MSDTPAWAGALWAVGGYVVGTLPFAYLVARARRATSVIREADRHHGETDAHVLMDQYLGRGWTAVAATLDTAKGGAYVLAARGFGDVRPNWLALIGVAAVLGHAWPPYARAMAGRGLAATAGVYLALLPIPMTVAGIVILIGSVAGQTGAASTLGLALVPLVAAIQGQPSAYVAMSGAMFALILLRRLEGLGEVVRGGIPWYRAVYYRLVFDASGPPGPSAVTEEK